jgi:GTPase SAR1 family protein
MKQIHEHSSPEVSIFLVANKSDLAESRKVQRESGEKLAESYGIKFYEVSAKDGSNVNELFTNIGQEAYGKIKKLSEKGQQGNLVLHEDDMPTKQDGGKGCSC